KAQQARHNALAEALTSAGLAGKMVADLYPQLGKTQHGLTAAATAIRGHTDLANQLAAASGVGLVSKYATAVSSNPMSSILKAQQARHNALAEALTSAGLAGKMVADLYPQLGKTQHGHTAAATAPTHGAAMSPLAALRELVLLLPVSRRLTKSEWTFLVQFVIYWYTCFSAIMSLAERAIGDEFAGEASVSQFGAVISLPVAYVVAAALTGRLGDSDGDSKDA
ncbi:hypothetical protein, partial [Isoptericola croceus]|uniref:hypothetical protein n=1 Tax=Isoptericola croceus TaxID=3031406 RepID=UPI0023F77E35